MSGTIRLALLGLPDTDEEELRELSGRLRRTLLELDVEDVRSHHADHEEPERTKGGELVTAGMLVVTAAPFVLRQAVRLTDTWLKNRPVRGVKVELDGRTIELGNATADERERLLDAFLAHRPRPDDDRDDPEPDQGTTQ
ncbi:hypothetical protein ACSNOK_28335 [Streptomyces sp. URMC 126]|uniref:hypothetical protein n=1 Tax=Streptomyces sp. URMC 126 TaxID=3423401 RepID=UPI003F19C612